MNQNQYRLLATLALFISFLQAAAQSGTITGKVTDEKGSPLAYVNVTLLKAADSSFTAGVISSGDGTFSFATPPLGKYFLRYSSIGFTEKQTAPFAISQEGTSITLEPVAMSQDAKTLREVSVTSLRPTITQLTDRLVVSVEGTALAAGTTAYDVLARAPGIYIDQDGNIQLNGRSGVTVMLDGRLTYLSARDLRTMLEGMSAENIKNIEIITNPSAKYDAEGASGMLNINLKKNVQKGMNGSMYAGYIYNGKQHAGSAGGNMNYMNRKWNSFLNLDMARRAGGREATFTRVFYGTRKTTYFDQWATGNFIVEGPPSIRLGTDYAITNKHSVGFMANYTSLDIYSDFLTDTYIGETARNPQLYIDANNYSNNTHKNLTGNLHYVGKLDTSGTTLTADLDYVRIRNHSIGDFLNYYDSVHVPGSLRRDFLYTNIPSGFDIHAGKVDFTRLMKRGNKMEAGLKASRVVSDNDSRFYFNNGPVPVPDPHRTNHFNYKEQIYAGYLNFSGSIGKRVTIQTGLRAEHTVSTGNSFTTGQVTPRNYTDLFPSVFVQQKVSEDYGINYSYSRRIQRPHYGNLNPFRFYRDPYTWIEGNPYLRSQYAHAFSLAQVYKKNYNLTLSYQYTTDIISELPSLNADSATTIYYTGNVDNGHNVSMTAIAPLRILKGWESNNTLLLSYNKLTMEVNKQELVNDRVFYMIQSNHTIQLPWELRLEMNILYRGPSVHGLYQIAPWFRTDAGIKKSFLKKKLDLTINANDLTKGQRLKFTTDIEGNINEFDQYFRTRTIGATLRYHFNKGQKTEERKRAPNLEELNRTGN